MVRELKILHLEQLNRGNDSVVLDLCLGGRHDELEGPL